MLVSVSGVCRADDQPGQLPLRWDPAWTHAGVWDYSLTGVGLATVGIETVLLQNVTVPPRWIGPILFDSAVHNLFRADAAKLYTGVQIASWSIWFTLVGYPLAVDVPRAWLRYGRQVAWDLFWQDATTLSLSGAADLSLRDSISRLRPGNTDCLNAGGTNCLNGPEASRSFPSGHVSETSTATALICTQHLTMHLYGSPWDAVTCASAIAADTADGVLRLVGDDHWATDVLAGAALGVAFGWGVPVLMHLHGHAPDDRTYAESPSVLIAPVPLALSHGAGLGVAVMY